MKTSLMTVRALTVALTAGTLALAACSTGESPTSAAPPATTVQTTAPADPSAPFGPGCAGLPASGPGSAEAIADQPVATAASQNPQLSTLVSAVTAAGLADTLNQAEAITVFAPTNDAFAKIPEATLKGVLADKKALTDILTYHVVPGAVPAADVVGLDGEAVTTVNGAAITVGVADDGSVTLTDVAGNDVAVVVTDVQASNGVIHVIDGVLLPA
jgi:uncharacterized surface protein with fasciclin (FAS1) repeats